MSASAPKRLRLAPLLLRLLPAAVGGALVAQEALPPMAPLRVMGEIPARLERVRPQPDGVMVLTLFLGGVRQAIDRGDELQVFDPATKQVLTAALVVGDTRPDTGSGRAHVRVRLAEAAASERLAELAPAARPDFPVALEARDRFVLEHGPRVTIVAPFEPEKGDDPAYFVRVVGEQADARVVGEGVVSPQAGYELRFSAPIDPATLQLSCVQVSAEQGATESEVPMRTFVVDADGTTFRFVAPLGLPFTAAMREQARADADLPVEQRRPHFRLSIAAGAQGVRTKAGGGLQLPLEVPLRIDPEAADNLVTWGQWR